jgi:peroxiredoxin
MLLSALLLIATLSANAAEPDGQVGKPALLFSLPAINEDAAQAIVGRPRVSLSRLVGPGADTPSRAVVLYFFSREQGGETLSALNRLQKKHGANGLVVVGISTDQGDLGALSDWLQGQKLTFPVVRDNHRLVSGRYGLPAQPAVVVVDRKGDIFAIGNPGATDFEAATESEINALLER